MQKDLTKGVYFNNVFDDVTRNIIITSTVTKDFELCFNEFTDKIVVKYYDKTFEYANLHEFMNDLMKGQKK